MNGDALNPAGAEVAAFGPIAVPKRLDSLDLLRGFAILGILFVNIQFFAMPLIASMLPPGPGDPLLDRLAWGFIKAFCELKFVSTFSVLFGAGMIMQMMRAERFGRGFAARYFRRIVILAVFGLVHAFAFWYGDILLFYAVLGALLFVFRRLDGKTLLRIGAGVLVAAVVIQSSCVGLQVVGQRLDEQRKQQLAAEQTDVATSEEETATATAMETESARSALDFMKEANWDPSSDAWTQGEISAYRDGPLVDALIYRAVSFLFILIFFVLGFGWHILGMFLIGAGLMKIGFFDAERSALQKRVGLIGLATGLPIELIHAWLYYGKQGQVSFLDVPLAAMHEVGAIALCMGYVGIISWIASSARGRSILHPMRAVGRMALTTYLGSTLIATFLMYWWGLGWFGSVGLFDQLMIVLCVYAGLLIASTVWLRAFAIGPLEWLWRSVTYMKIQPILRVKQPAP